MNHVRRIAFKNLYNFRDLGGYQGCDGRVTSWNRLYRCDCPSALSDDGWQTFDELDIKTLIDLRSTFEAIRKPVKVPEGVKYLDCHFFSEEGIGLKNEAKKQFLKSLSLDYRVMTESSLDRIVYILSMISQSLEYGNTAFFCTLGKDRTGIIAAEILRICGVSDEDIIADYSMTEIYTREVIKSIIENIPKENLMLISPETMARADTSKPETMREYLTWSSEFGFSDRINEKGFTFKMQDELKNRLLS